MSRLRRASTGQESAKAGARKYYNINYHNMQDSAESIKVKFISWLLRGGLSFSAATDAIGTEVLFSRNKRKADLLLISRSLHAFEIKSDRDTIKKFYAQLPDYLHTFPRFSVITTPKYFKQVKRLAPESTGLILFESGVFHVKRKAATKTKPRKDNLLMFLSKTDLIREFKTKGARALSTQALRNRIAENEPASKIYPAALKLLRERYRNLFKLFMRDTAGIILRDDLRGLTGKIEKITS